MLICSQVLQASNCIPKPGLACLKFPTYIHKVFIFTNSEGFVKTCSESEYNLKPSSLLRPSLLLLTQKVNQRRLPS
ncbi:hypothetical protein I79_007760 [Cricetulus griseus]|uniref:Uncharacterized protein n=1 Tax=Cricetulus griseus TaxID=10029 RepID=G3HBD2_CRIGR|nr:hypothetical protein I79_007760 [Cricetulus griseus]